MDCPRHRQLASKHDDFGHPLCDHCFIEARELAEAKALEDKILSWRLDQTSVAQLIVRLGWSE